MEVVPASGQRAASGPDLDQFSREPRQNARTCRVQNDIVLDADAAPPGTVDSWLDRDNGALGERTLGGASETWRFMHLETDAMSEPVAEQLAKTAPFDVATGDRIRVTPGHAGANVLRGLLIRLANDVVYLALLVCRSATHDGPRAVRAVALDFRADAEEQDVAVTDLRHRGSRVRKRRPRSGRHDGRERKAFAAFVAQRALEH